MASACWASHQISSSSTICCQSSDSSTFSLWRRSWIWNWESCIWSLGTTRLGASYKWIHDYFHKQTRAPARQLLSELRATTLGGRSMREFLMQIKIIFDSRLDWKSNHASRACWLNFQRSSIEFSLGYFNHWKLVRNPTNCGGWSLLLAHEACLNKFNKQSLSYSPSINYMQAHNKSFSSHGSDGYMVPNKSFLHSDPESFSNSRGGGFNNRGGGWCDGTGGGGRGRGWFANFQCQVCLKYGHTTSVCHYRHEQHYQPNSTLVLQDPTTMRVCLRILVIGKLILILGSRMVIIVLLMFE